MGIVIILLIKIKRKIKLVKPLNFKMGARRFRYFFNYTRKLIYTWSFKVNLLIRMYRADKKTFEKR